MIIVSKQDEKPPILSKKLSELVIDELELQVEEEQGAVDEKAKTEMTILDCTTPTAKEHKIPDLMTCPPAPRKRKVSLAVKDNASNKVRVVKEFFASPDLEAMLGINKVSSRISWTTRRSHR